MSDLLNLVETSKPGTVQFEIKVNWPNGEPTRFIGMDATFQQAAERFEVLAEELRAALVEVGK